MVEPILKTVHSVTEGSRLSKVICEYCGTIYAAEKGACPICGNPYSPENTKPCEEPQEKQDAPKRPEASKEPTIPVPEIPLKKAKAQPPEQANPPKKVSSEPRSGSSKGHFAGTVSRKDKTICIVLGLLAAGALLYGGYRILSPYLGSSKEPAVSVPPSSSAVSCTGLAMETSLTLTAQGQSQALHVTKTPSDATEALRFVSDKPAVATVSPEGMVEAVGPGQAVITVTCGQASAVCTVTCAFTPGESTAPEPSTDGPEESTGEPEESTGEPEESTGPVGQLSLSSTDITLFQKGETARLTAGSLPGSRLQWSSEDETVATVENGVVTAVGPGTTEIQAVYEDQTLTCVVRCRFEDTEEGEAVISHTDVTLEVGESFTLLLRQANGQALDVAWSSGDVSVCTVDGNTVTAVGSGDTEVTGIYEGVTYTCVVRVK